MEKNIKWHEKLMIQLFSLFLVIVAIWVVVIPITMSKAFYLYEFQKNDVVNATGYSMQQLSVIADSIIGFLFHRIDTMQVEIGGQIVFSNQALIHMSDVRDLYDGGLIIGFVIFILTFAMGCYMFFKRKKFKNHLFKHTMIIYAVVGTVLLAVLVFAIINFDLVFDFFHHVIFPDPQKYNDAFFSLVSNYSEATGVDNLMLVKILSIELFQDAGIIIVSFTAFIILSWSIYCFIVSKIIKNRVANSLKIE